jgi:hypothetical protein
LSIDVNGVTPLEDITRRVDLLRKDVYGGHDNERFHGDEDEILVDALAAIASGDPESQDIAKEALATQRIAYTRWRA